MGMSEIERQAALLSARQYAGAGMTMNATEQLLEVTRLLLQGAWFAGFAAASREKADRPRERCPYLPTVEDAADRLRREVAAVEGGMVPPFRKEEQ